MTGTKFPLLFGRGSIEAHAYDIWRNGNIEFPLLFGRGSIEA